MTMKLLYFTATGNSLYVAKRLGGELISIPQAIKARQYEFDDDKVGLVFPIYGLAVPPYIEAFVRKLKLNSPYVFAVMTYGMLDGNAAGHLVRIADECGIKLSYVRTIKMVDSWLLNFDMAKQIENEPRKDIEAHLDEIVSDIHKGVRRSSGASAFGKLATRLYDGSSKFAIGAGVAKNFVVQDSCVGCGTCVKVCPLTNVKLQDRRPHFGENCMSCLACTQNCPSSSIRIKKEKGSARFRNQHITLNEIVAANR